MALAPVELYRDEHHACLMFTDLVEEDAQAVQANQFLIVDHGTGAIIDAVNKGESARLTINFGKNGIKELDTAFAKLESV